MQYFRLHCSKGFSLLELMVVLVVASLLASLAVPAYQQFISRAKIAKIAKSIGDIQSMHVKLNEFRLKNNDQLPASLNELDMGVFLDAWGQPYEYLNILTAGPGNGGLRKDGGLNPLNTDYDLYSIGADGTSAEPLSAQASRDDIVRANDGAYIGLGEDY